MIGIWTASQLMPVDVPSLQRMSEAAFTIADSESLEFDPLKNEDEFTRSLTALEDPRLIENAGLNETEQELPELDEQVVEVEDPHAAFVFASIRTAANVATLEAA